VAVTIGASCEKSVELLVISAASTISCWMAAPCAFVALHESETRPASCERRGERSV
jgi:hypothetical protein